jgi:ADP-ribosylglycohydrolase
MASSTSDDRDRETPSVEQFAACLIGQCLGDALGFMVEGHGTETCQNYVEEVLRPFRLAGYRCRGYAIGQYSDDSQLARELVQSSLRALKSCHVGIEIL